MNLVKRNWSQVYTRYYLRIRYIYYDQSMNYDIVHQIGFENVSNYLAKQKTNILRKDDIISLLKDDGAQFIEDSIRIYEPESEAFSLVPDDWEYYVEEYVQTLVFCIKSANFQIKERIYDISYEVRDLKELLQTHIINSTEEMKTIFRKEIQMINNNGNNVVKPIFDTLDSHQIDIAIMYSEPLAEEDENGIKAVGDPTEYEEECNKLLDILKSKEIQVNVCIKIATIENLIQILQKSPKILHIICHGEFDEKENQFYLCFEENGKLEKLTSKRLKEIVSGFQTKTELVFVNACHSEEVAKVFREAGVNRVVAVQSELKIQDHIAQRFAGIFYSQLFDGFSVQEAHYTARVTINKKDTYTCCCAHAHKPKCKWHERAKRKSANEMHFEHIPNCICKQKNKLRHDKNCKWADNFCDKFGVERKMDDIITTCCCSPELYHNETMKFKLLYSDELDIIQPLFGKRPKGKVLIEGSYSCIERKFAIKRLTGRNSRLYQMFKYLTQSETKFVNLFGIEGIGKSSLAKQSANYLYERGFFMDKIAIINLDKEANIHYFWSELFKEVPNAYDFESFCDSIEKKTILFILQRADTLIRQNSEEIKQDFALISEKASNVKFIIITEKSIIDDLLPLRVSSLNLGPLNRIDAAKLLCKNASDFLDLKYKNPYELQRHEIFEIPLTPPQIWSIAERLKQKKMPFDYIAREFILKNKESNLNERFEDHEGIKITLEEIKSSNLIAYELMISLCAFPSGLGYQDLEELESQGKIPKMWGSILFFYLSLKENGEEFSITPEETEDGNEIDRDIFKSNNYIWIDIRQDSPNDETYFVPMSFITNYVQTYLIKDSVRENITMLEYMTSLSLAMIDRIKANKDIYHEKLVEFSSISNLSLWRINESKFYNDKDAFQKLARDAENLKKHLQSHRRNFIHCLNPKILNDILEINPKARDYLLELIGVLYLLVPTLFKILSSPEEAKNFATRALITIKIKEKMKEYPNLELLIDSPYLKVIDAKLNLFLTGLYLQSKVSPEKNLPLANTLIVLMNRQTLQKIEDEELKKILSLEIAFARAYYLYRKKKIVNKDSNYHHFEGALRRLDGSPDIYQAKVMLLKLKAQNKFEDMELNLQNDISNEESTFEVNGCLKLLMKICYRFSDLKLKFEKKKILEYQDIEGAIKLLENIKTGPLRKSLEIAKKIKSDKYELQIERILLEVDQEIKMCYSNVITIMHGLPLIDDNNKTLEDLTKILPNFRNSIIQELDKYKKKLYLKFERLTKKKLEEAIIDGCYILQISCDNIEPNSDYLEAEQDLEIDSVIGRSERINSDYLRKVFQSSAKINKTVHILILAVKRGLVLAESLLGLGIPHIITFNFDPWEDVRQKIYQDKCIEKFCIYFYRGMLENLSITEAISSAKKRVTSYLGELFFQGYFHNSSSLIEKALIHLPKNETHVDILYKKIPLAVGNVKNVTKEALNNFFLSDFRLPFIGRNLDLFRFSNIIFENKNFIITLNGAPGIGKTAFVKELGLYLLNRSSFSDGIFYISFKNLRTHDEPKEFLQKAMGKEFKDDICALFENKKMLLIFDDFEYFMNNKAESRNVLFNGLGNFGITRICVRTQLENYNLSDKLQNLNEKSFQQNKKIEEMLNKSSHYDLDPLNEDHLALILLSLISPNESISREKLRECVRFANGNVSLLIDNLIKEKIKIDETILEINLKYSRIFLAKKNSFQDGAMIPSPFEKKSFTFSSNQLSFSDIEPLDESNLMLRINHQDSLQSNSIFEEGKSYFQKREDVKLKAPKDLRLGQIQNDNNDDDESEIDF